jgi:hypothetical protein
MQRWTSCVASPKSARASIRRAIRSLSALEKARSVDIHHVLAMTMPSFEPSTALTAIATVWATPASNLSNVTGSIRSRLPVASGQIRPRFAEVSHSASFGDNTVF